MSLFAFRDSVSGKFVFHRNHSVILDDLNSAPFDIGGLYQIEEGKGDAEFWKYNPSISQLEYQLKTKMEMVKIKIIRYDSGETKEYTESFPPLKMLQSGEVYISNDPNVFELYEVI